MRALAVVMSAALLVGGCGREDTAGVDGPADDPAFDAATVSRLDAAVAGAMTAARIPGALIGVWSPEGNYVSTPGVADLTTGAPLRAGYHSRIGSVTKTFTATAVLHLVKLGKLRLDDPIGDHLEGVPGGATITVRQLATMLSGLPDYQQNPEFEKQVLADPRRDFSPAELLGWAFDMPPAFEPGEHYQYSNTNYVLLGQLVEKLGGAPLGDYLTENVLKPLGMRDTSFPTGTQFPDPHPRGYTDPLESGGPPVDATDWTASFTWAAGALISTLEDLRVWAPALASGSLIGPELHAQQLTSPAVPGLPAGVGYGIGVFITAGWIGHNGSAPGYQTVVIHLPQRSMTVAVMVNTDITPPDGPQPSTAVAKAITSVLTPANIYDV